MMGYAQPKGGKLSATTRLILADRDGKISLDQAKTHLKEMAAARRRAKAQANQTQGSEVEITSTSEDKFPFATPFTSGGKKMVQCWINLADNNTSEIEALGVNITARFAGKAIADIPVDVLEQVAALTNVRKVAVAKILAKKTYVSRQLTNVDDLLNLTTDAQNAGLSQAYNGSGVVLGVIDTGIDFAHSMLSGTRLKKKYVYNTTSEAMEEYAGTTAKYTDETHGTHTSTIAGGSNLTSTAYVYTTGTSYTTVNNAQFGGMAPGTDLVLCDLGEQLSDANIAWSMQKIAEYAESVGKPYVISLSLGGHFGPHDGTGDMADVCAQLTGPGKVIVFAAGNEGEDGIYLGKNASASNPAQSVLSSQTRSSYSVDYGMVLSYARTPNTELAVRYHVVNTNSNTILWTSNEITTDDYFVDNQGNIELYGAEISVNDVGSDGTTKLSTYFTAYNNDSDNYGYLCGYMDLDPHNNKWYVETILYYLKAVNNNYKIAMSVYPRTGTSYVDSWPASYIDFTASSAKYNNVAFTAGNNESSASDESSFPSVISVGSYVSSKYWRAGTTSGSNQTWTNNGTYQQISMFSSYQSEGSGPTGLKQPWITAPGEVILAGYNSSYTPESNYYYAYGSNKKLGAMSGTSMACPCVAGITCLFLQANPQLTPAQIKTVMKETAIKDTYVNGTYASHFGQGKIDALAGVQYILQNMSGPMITVDPTSLSLSVVVGQSASQTITVTGSSLQGDINVQLSGSNCYSVDKTTITQSGGIVSTTLTVTFSPTFKATMLGSITLSSPGAEDVTIALTSFGLQPQVVAGNNAVSMTAEAGESATVDLTVAADDLVGDITATLSDANGVFSLSSNTISQTAATTGQGTSITITYAPTAVATHNATLTLSSPYAENVVVTLTGTATPGTPKFTLDKTSMSFSSKLNDPKTESVTISAKNLTGNVTATLTDANGVFSVSPASLTAAQAMAGAAFTVTFNSANEGDFTGTLTIATDGVQAQTVALSAEAMDGGTASDAYLDIAKYATIDAAGWNTSFINNFYQYTEDTANEVAWLTVPAYAALVGAKYAVNNNTFGSGNPQKWVETNVTSTNNTYVGRTWNASSPSLGSSAYFTTTTARAMGNGSTSATTSSTVTFYVTNTTAVQLYGYNGTRANRWGTNYPTTLNIYECTVNPDGTLTASTTDIANQSNSTNSTAVTLTKTGLDETKVYKVVAGQMRGYLYELAFQTPLPQEPQLSATPTSVSMETKKGTTTTQTFTVSGKNLSENVTATLNDENGVFSLSTTTITPAQAKAGQSVTVTFAPTAKTTYTASITLASAGVEDVVINLSGTGTWTLKRGDVTMNGVVDVEDVDAIAAILAGHDADHLLYDHDAADINRDDFVTLADLTLLVNGFKYPQPDPDYPEDDGEGHDLIIPGGGEGEPSEGDVKEEKDF